MAGQVKTLAFGIGVDPQTDNHIDQLEGNEGHNRRPHDGDDNALDLDQKLCDHVIVVALDPTQRTCREHTGQNRTNDAANPVNTDRSVTGGTYELTMEKFQTPYVGLVIRTLANPEDAADLDIAHKLQDQIRVAAESDKAFVLPDYDKASYKATLEPILELAKGLKRYTETFGSKQEVNPVHFMIGTASAWGGLPDTAAVYENIQPNLPVGKYELTVKDVPVSGFWSISLYNEQGYFQKNSLNAYSLNNLTAKPNSDGSYTLRFGGCTASTENCLPIMRGWNYAVRMYEPGKAIVDGSWKFPGPPVPRAN